MGHRNRLRGLAVIVGLILLPAAIGVIAVHASPTCERFVRLYVSKPVRNRVSVATQAAWASWRVGHSNWKPNPKVQRPKNVMSREESLTKVKFACSIPTEQTALDIILTPAEVAPPVVELPPMEATQIAFPEASPPEVAEVPPEEAKPSGTPVVPFPPVQGGGNTAPPVIVPPVLPSLVPEPPSWMLSGLGTLCLWLLALATKRGPARASARVRAAAR